MKLAVIADIHGNREAFEACLEHALGQGAQRFALLGDYVGYGADPGWVVDRVRELVESGAAQAVLGNHDAAVLEGPSPRMQADAREAVLWTREALDVEQTDFLASLPDTVLDPDCLFVHANAVEPREWRYVYTPQDAARSLEASGRPYVFCGHSHEPALFRLGSDGQQVVRIQPTPGLSVELTPGHCWLCIPGAAGQPRDGNPAAGYVMFDRTAGVLTFHRVPYDHETTAGKILAAGLPPRLAERLIEGV